MTRITGYISIYLAVLLVLFLGVPRAGFAAEKKTSPTPVYTYKVVNTFPHDMHAFTQGLFIDDGFLYEGTGLAGQSALRKINMKDGKVEKKFDLPAQFFGEGITLAGDRIVQLTWHSHIGFVYDRKSFSLLQTFTYPTEGWGITTGRDSLIMSDGSATLYFLDMKTFREVRRITVTDNGNPVAMLNELEYIHGEIFANVWMTDMIAKIDPETGRVTGWIDLSGLLPNRENGRTERTLNGIAFDAVNDRIFVTGKLWPSLYEIILIPRK